MASAKSVFERATVASETSPKLSKKPASKWDKPKSVPPPAVNRDSVDNTDQQTIIDSELPPPAYTKNMLAKFQALQQSDGAQPVKDSTDVNSSSKPRKVQSLCSFHFVNLDVICDGTMVACRTFDRKVVGPTAGQVPIKWLLLGWVMSADI